MVRRTPDRAPGLRSVLRGGCWPAAGCSQPLLCFAARLVCGLRWGGAWYPALLAPLGEHMTCRRDARLRRWLRTGAAAFEQNMHGQGPLGGRCCAGACHGAPLVVQVGQHIRYAQWLA